LLLFDRSIRTIELTKSEYLRVASFLTGNINSETTNANGGKRRKHSLNDSVVRTSQG
jgi:hypothetical protein